MMQKCLIAASLLVFIVGPALAAEYYVAQNPNTKKCKIVKVKPDGTAMVIVGTSSYATMHEAKVAKKAAKAKGDCK